MEKEKLLTELTAKIGTTSLSSRTIRDYVDAILPGITDDAQVNDAFYNTHKAILKTMEGQLNNEVATKVNTFKTEWENTHKVESPKKEEKPVEKPVEKATEKFSESKEYKALMDEITALKDAKSEEVKAAKVKALRDEVLSKAKDLNVSNGAIWNDVVNAAQIGDDANAESLLATVKATYESKLTSYLGEGVMPYSGQSHVGSSATPEAAKAKRDAFKQRMIDSGRLPKVEN